MVKLDKTKLSEYRSKMRRLIDAIEKRAFNFCENDPLVRGSAYEVFRRCGQEGCKCQDGDENRHGPYKVIQVFKDGKQRQISISKQKEHLWEKAKDWQLEMQRFSELKEACKILQSLCEEVLEERLED